MSVNWYKRITAMPLANVRCPNNLPDETPCNTKLEVDVRQRTDENGSSEYKPGITGECFTQCPVCKQFISIDYHWTGRGMIYGLGIPTPATLDEVMEEIRNGKYFVRCVEADDPSVWESGAESGNIDNLPSEILPINEDKLNKRKQKMPHFEDNKLKEVI